MHQAANNGVICNLKYALRYKDLVVCFYYRSCYRIIKGLHHAKRIIPWVRQ